ncbi:MAG: SCO family protein [Proteobacteria bacterium]|nr:MAG: SCO family protein [Pseudomonadota bacterium]
MSVRLHKQRLVWALVLFAFGAAAEQLGGDFTLTADDGRRLTLGQLAGRPVLLAFGYTHCPDICPTTLAQLSRAVDMLEDGNVHVLFVTLDPGRDDADRLSGYVKFFDRRFVGLTGTAEEIAAVARAYGVRFDTYKDGGALAYTVDHSTDIYLLDEAGGIAAIFPFGTPADRIADAIATLGTDR